MKNVQTAGLPGRLSARLYPEEIEYLIELTKELQDGKSIQKVIGDAIILASISEELNRVDKIFLSK